MLLQSGGTSARSTAPPFVSLFLPLTLMGKWSGVALMLKPLAHRPQDSVSHSVEATSCKMLVQPNHFQLGLEGSRTFKDLVKVKSTFYESDDMLVRGLSCL